MKKLALFLPLVLFAVVAGFLAVGLRLNPRDVPSPLVDKAAPTFTVTSLHEPARQIDAQDLRGKVWVLNVWASWCAACRIEHPTLVEWARSGGVLLYGLNYKDKRVSGLKWLSDHGNPYVDSFYDAEGRIGIDFGVYGVPETFVIDKAGLVRMKHIGPLSEEAIRDKLEPLIKELGS